MLLFGAVCSAIGWNWKSDDLLLQNISSGKKSFRHVWAIAPVVDFNALSFHLLKYSVCSVCLGWGRTRNFWFTRIFRGKVFCICKFIFSHPVSIVHKAPTENIYVNSKNFKGQTVLYISFINTNDIYFFIRLQYCIGNRRRW